MAVLLEGSNQYEEAIKEHRINYLIIKKDFGESYDSLSTLNSIGELMCRSGHYEESIQIENDVYNAYTKMGISRECYFINVRIQSTLGVDYYELGRKEEAQELLKYVFEEFRRPGRAYMPNVIRYWNKKTEVLQGLGIDEKELEETESYNNKFPIISIYGARYK